MAEIVSFSDSRTRPQAAWRNYAYCPPPTEAVDRAAAGREIGGGAWAAAMLLAGIAGFVVGLVLL